MKLNKDYKIWESAASDIFRPAICGILVQNTENLKRIVSTDGHKLVVLWDIEFDEDDYKGEVIVDKDIFINAAKNLKKNEQAEIKIEKEKSAVISGKFKGLTKPNIKESYPDIDRVIPYERDHITFSINAEYLRELSRSINSEIVTFKIPKSSCNIDLNNNEITGIDGAILINRIPSFEDKSMALIMPVRTA